MSTPRIEPYSIKVTGICPTVVWQALCDFGNKQWDEGAKNLLSQMDKTVRNTETWAVAFDFCRLSGKKDVLNTLTEKYASIFGKAPPEWVNIQAKTPEPPSASKGATLNILSVTIPESEQYESIRIQLETSRTALLIKFTPGKPLSWQSGAVERLARTIADVTSWKLPIFGENLEVAVTHILKINADSRTENDWNILFFCLRCMARVEEFEEQAFQYAMAKGISPPSYSPLHNEDKSKWFETAESKKDIGQDTGGDIISASGSLSAIMHTINSKAVQRLQTKPSVTIDMQAISHIDFSSAMDFVAMHDKLALSKRTVLVNKPSALVKQMLITVGLPEKSIKGTWVG